MVERHCFFNLRQFRLQTSSFGGIMRKGRKNVRTTSRIARGLISPAEIVRFLKYGFQAD